MDHDFIRVRGAKENNLRDVDIDIPRDKFVVMTGLSGSGKSSLAFDTIYAEGRRRYVESLSAYARQFLGNSDKPNVDSIDGLSPAISIDQKTTSRNPRSTVGTVTEIYDHLRLLFARVGTPYCINHHIPIESQSIEEMVNKILELEEKTKLIIMSPVVTGQKGTFAKDFDRWRKEGYSRVRVDGEVYDIEHDFKLEKNKKHNIEIVVDRLVIKEGIRTRLTDSVETAVNLADGKMIVDVVGEGEQIFSEKYACKLCDFSLPELEPRMFSFNAPYGACPHCNGLGTKLEVDEDLVIPNKTLSIREGAIKPFGSFEKGNYTIGRVIQVCEHYDIDMDIPVSEVPKNKLDILLYGSPDKIHFTAKSKSGYKHESHSYFEGIIPNLERLYLETNSNMRRDWIEGFMRSHTCPVCKGARLTKEILSVKVADKNINDITEMSIAEAHDFFTNIELNHTNAQIAELVLKEIVERLSFLKNVGLDYLTLNRSAGTLSGGEAQRIRLATQIGSRLSGVLYVLDEPSIGLHQRDNDRLINTLKEMRDLGNTLIVVEHDEDTMLESDYLIDIGPGAGIEGGTVVSMGTPAEVMADPSSITGDYLSGRKSIKMPESRRTGNGKFVEVIGAKENNLKNVRAKFPLGTLTCVTGVSGSGKSSLVNEILYKGIAANLYRTKELPGKHKEIKGLEHIDKIIDISQSPIGRTPRSNPATYVGVFDNIRDLFATTNEAKIRGYQKGRFSFNVKGGRCEVCSGDGVKKIEMHFLPDVYVECEACKGTRYNRETLDVKYKGKNIAEVLQMTVMEAHKFFENVPKIKNKLAIMEDVGLGYIHLGQSATTLSGGEAQRIKLAKELQKRATGKTMFILDEPTTGLHIADVEKLIAVMQRIVDNGDTVVVIEHNLEVVKIADHIIDIGPEGGNRGGKIIFKGTPEAICECEESHTGRYLKMQLEREKNR